MQDKFRERGLWVYMSWCEKCENEERASGSEHRRNQKWPFSLPDLRLEQTKDLTPYLEFGFSFSLFDLFSSHRTLSLMHFGVHISTTREIRIPAAVG